MPQVGSGYTLSAATKLSFEEAVARVREELAGEGFGVLTEIDVQATIEKKLGLDHDPYIILGACKPPLAHAALSVDPEIGTLLPCNVVVYERAGETFVSAIDPERMLSIVDNEALAETAAEVKRSLTAVVDRVAQG